jgi:hypothetical protein
MLVIFRYIFCRKSHEFHVGSGITGIAEVATAMRKCWFIVCGRGSIPRSNFLFVTPVN